MIDDDNAIPARISNKVTLPSKYMVVDLGSGRFCATDTGHEFYNLEQNADGRFYGYLPPHDNPNIKKLGAKPGDDYVDDVMIVYVSKCQGSNDRKIVGFTDKARVYAKSQPGGDLKRFIKTGGKLTECSYTIESDYIYDLRGFENPFVFTVEGESAYWFRSQRFYAGTHPNEEKRMNKWLKDYLESKFSEEDIDFDFQKQVHGAIFKCTHDATYKTAPTYHNSNQGRTVEKKAWVSKLALKEANYRCSFNKDHDTFLTKKGVPYMEGHHLIPCTVSNSENFWKMYGCNIDCVENIVSLCPTCHRLIHFGNEDKKREIITSLYHQHITKLQSVGLNISLEQLLECYQL